MTTVTAAQVRSGDQIVTKDGSTVTVKFVARVAGDRVRFAWERGATLAQWVVRADAEITTV